MLFTLVVNTGNETETSESTEINSDTIVLPLESFVRVCSETGAKVSLYQDGVMILEYDGVHLTVLNKLALVGWNTVHKPLFREVFALAQILSATYILTNPVSYQLH